MATTKTFNPIAHDGRTPDDFAGAAPSGIPVVARIARLAPPPVAARPAPTRSLRIDPAVTPQATVPPPRDAPAAADGRAEASSVASRVADQPPLPQPMRHAPEAGLSTTLCAIEGAMKPLARYILLAALLTAAGLSYLVIDQKLATEEPAPPAPAGDDLRLTETDTPPGRFASPQVALRSAPPASAYDVPREEEDREAGTSRSIERLPTEQSRSLSDEFNAAQSSVADQSPAAEVRTATTARGPAAAAPVPYPSTPFNAAGDIDAGDDNQTQVPAVARLPGRIEPISLPR